MTPSGSNRSKHHLARAQEALKAIKPDTPQGLRSGGGTGLRSKRQLESLPLFPSQPATRQDVAQPVKPGPAESSEQVTYPAGGLKQQVKATEGGKGVDIFQGMLGGLRGAIGLVTASSGPQDDHASRAAGVTAGPRVSFRQPADTYLQKTLTPRAQRLQVAQRTLAIANSTSAASAASLVTPPAARFQPHVDQLYPPGPNRLLHSPSSSATPRVLLETQDDDVILNSRIKPRPFSLGDRDSFVI